jgi:ATP-dependent helicase/DNAse subunit B
LLKYILKVDEYESTLASRLGTYAHGILEFFEKDKENFDYESSKEKMISEIYAKQELTLEDKFYLDRSDAYIKEIIEFNNKQELNSKIDEIKTEEDIKVVLHDGKVIFDGKIDKQYLKTIGDTKYVAVIDYKTYIKENNLLNIEDGFNLQLPVYLYLISSQNPNIHYMGIYLQLFDFKVKKYNEKDKEYKLKGFTSAEEQDLSILSNDYATNNSVGNYISLRLTKTGFHPQDLNKVLAQSEFKDLIEVARNKIEELITHINSLEFEIRPCAIDKDFKEDAKDDDEVNTSRFDHIACSYCTMKDICYMKNNDIKILPKKPFKSILKEAYEKEKAEANKEKLEEMEEE